MLPPTIQTHLLVVVDLSIADLLDEAKPLLAFRAGCDGEGHEVLLLLGKPGAITYFRTGVPIGCNQAGWDVCHKGRHSVASEAECQGRNEVVPCCAGGTPDCCPRAGACRRNNESVGEGSVRASELSQRTS